MRGHKLWSHSVVSQHFMEAEKSLPRSKHTFCNMGFFRVTHIHCRILVSENGKIVMFSYNSRHRTIGKMINSDIHKGLVVHTEVLTTGQVLSDLRFTAETKKKTVFWDVMPY
jgi:hypothetical protein